VTEQDAVEPYVSMLRKNPEQQHLVDAFLSERFGDHGLLKIKKAATKEEPNPIASETMIIVNSAVARGAGAIAVNLSGGAAALEVFRRISGKNFADPTSAPDTTTSLSVSVQGEK
jgi:hypothetical protein